MAQAAGRNPWLTVYATASSLWTNREGQVKRQSGGRRRRPEATPSLGMIAWRRIRWESVSGGWQEKRQVKVQVEDQGQKVRTAGFGGWGKYDDYSGFCRKFINANLTDFGIRGILISWFCVTLNSFWKSDG